MPKSGKKNHEVPSLYSISGSANWYNQIDNGIVVYWDKELDQVDVHVQKVRYSWLGKLCTVSYKYNVYTRQYEPIGETEVEPAPF